MIITLTTINFFILYFIIFALIFNNMMIILELNDLTFEEYFNWFLDRIRSKLLFYWILFLNIIMFLNENGIDPIFVFLFIVSFF